MRTRLPAVVCLALLSGFPASPGQAEQALHAGDVAQALELFEGRLRDDPQDLSAACGAVEALLSAGDVDAALERAQRLDRRFSDAPAVLAARGRALFRAGRLTAAEQALGPLASEAAAPGRGLIALARLRAARGRHTDAAELAEAALQREPADPFVWFWASELVARRERTRELLERYVAASPSSQLDWVEAARGTLRLREALGERRVWIVEDQPERVELPLRVVWDDNGRKLGYVVEARVGPKDKPVRLMLDTGSSGLFLVERMARKRGIEFLSEEIAFGGGGDQRHRNRRGVFDSFRLGGLRYRAALVGTTRRELEPYGRYHGLLGIQALAGYRVILDFPAQKLILIRDDVAPNESAGEPFWIVSGQLLVQAAVDHGPQGMFLLDTGATWSILSNRMAARVPGVQREATSGVRGFGGTVEGASIVKGAEVRFAGHGSGEAALRAFDMGLRSSVSDVEVSGFVGLDLLSTKRVTIDTVRQRVLVETVAHGASPN